MRLQSERKGLYQIQMKVKQSVVISATIVAASILLGPTTVLGRRKTPSAAELMARARKLTDIRAQGGRPFRLQGDVTLFGTPDGTVKGTYTLLWASPEKWRETMAFPGHSWTRVLVGHEMWSQRSLPTIGFQAYLMRSALDHRPQLAPKKSHKTLKVKARETGGVQQWCFRNGYHSAEPTLCFDAASGLLLTDGYKHSFTEFSHYERWGSKLVPRAIAVIIDKATVAEFRAEQLATLNHPSLGMLAPPPRSAESAGCQDPSRPKVLKGMSPHFPRRARANGISGMVKVLAQVEVDGKIDPELIISPSKVFYGTVLHALSRWRFRPAACQGTPVPAQVTIEINFRFNH